MSTKIEEVDKPVFRLAKPGAPKTMLRLRQPSPAQSAVEKLREREAMLREQIAAKKDALSSIRSRYEVMADEFEPQEDDLDPSEAMRRMYLQSGVGMTAREREMMEKQLEQELPPVVRRLMKE